ncbi:TPA: relaxase/mobilization nuclease domain-containing protein [Pseudomonas aeruginosa]|nr:relaxase/mobilization nuclease domain-containing protein [Pseudomonas aeruginosa]HEJ6151363.1 relaxase/mobilization nuclease domain-containing protein [Pseudomonas aeruginosa]
MALDIVSHGRRGPGGVLRFSPEQIQQIKRTVSRTPEVMVKVSGGGRDLGGVRTHLKYIGRHGKLPLETDEGLTIQGKDAAQEIAQDWSLDQCRSQYRPKPAAGEKDTRPKLAHNIVLSMPAGTPPEKVLAAARTFARENFALRHRYAMALHTDQTHPHVHLVVKCESEYEPGKRLYIRKDTLRRWREQFAELMREQGVAANATPRQVRGQVRRPQRDAIHHRLRAMRAFGQLGAAERSRRTMPRPSTFMREKVMAMVKALKGGSSSLEQGKETLQRTRDAVTDDWRSTAQTLRWQGQADLAERVERFVARMPPVQTDAQRRAERWQAQQRAPTPERSRTRAPDERSR